MTRENSSHNSTHHFYIPYTPRVRIDLTKRIIIINNNNNIPYNTGTMMRRAFLLPSSASSASVLSSFHRRVLPLLRRAASSTSTRPEREEVLASSSGLSQAPDQAADADAATIDPGSSSSAQPGWGLFPEDIVAHLDKYIVSQGDAKKATAIAMRMRWRRNQLPDEIRAEVTPSNILMKGPTGTGKTEIARRLSTLAEAPFIKVEATRYTEVVSDLGRTGSRKEGGRVCSPLHNYSIKRLILSLPPLLSYRVLWVLIRVT